jgi:hypothetical protein
LTVLLYLVILMASTFKGTKRRAKEAKEMKRHWLRGMLLGLSLSLLLAGGVALAQGLLLTADKTCVLCYPGTVTPMQIPDQYVVNLSGEGFQEGHTYCGRLYHNDEPVMKAICGDPGVLLATGSFFVTCDPPAFFVFTDIPEAGYFHGEVEDYRGEWMVQAVELGTDSAASVGWLVADVCVVEEEFVPEAGTIALLGSGLAGLAGYAALRWRSRQ